MFGTLGYLEAAWLGTLSSLAHQIACYIDVIQIVWHTDPGEHSPEEAGYHAQRRHLPDRAPQSPQHLHRAVWHPYAIC